MGTWGKNGNEAANPAHSPSEVQAACSQVFSPVLPHKAPQFRAVCHFCSNHKAISCIFFLFLSKKLHCLSIFLQNKVQIPLPCIQSPFRFEFDLPLQVYFPLFSFMSSLLEPNRSTHCWKAGTFQAATFGNATSIPPNLFHVAKSFPSPGTGSSSKPPTTSGYIKNLYPSEILYQLSNILNSLLEARHK